MDFATTKLRPALAILAAVLAIQPPPTFAASHREAPITALDQKADITDWFAFVSPEHPDRVIGMLTSDGKIHAASDKEAVIGTYGTTSRRRLSVLGESSERGGWAQVQRLGNPLINEAVIGTGSKDRFSMDDPTNDKQFANFLLNPLISQILGTLGVPVPPAPRTDLLLLVQYMAPICPGCAAADAGPIADLLRLNTGIPPTSITSQKRLGFLAGDNAGFPNGRRPADDVLDIALRALGGILVDGKKYGTPLGD
jgi:hypothetical protein